MPVEDNKLVGAFPVEVTAGYDETMFFLVVYDVPGDYVATIWLTAA